MLRIYFKNIIIIFFIFYCMLYISDTAYADFGKIKLDMTKDEIEAQFHTYNSDMFSLDVLPDEINIRGNLYNVINASKKITITFNVGKKIENINYIFVTSRMDFYELRAEFIEKFGKPIGEMADGYDQNCAELRDVACVNAIYFYDKIDDVCISMAWPNDVTEKQLMEQRGVPSSFDVRQCITPK